MQRLFYRLIPVGLLLAILCLTGCGAGASGDSSGLEVQAAPAHVAPLQPNLRATGTVQALQAISLRVPQISGLSSRVTLSYLIPNGSKVEKDDTVAEFDRTALMDEAREAAAKLAELGHQLDEKKAQNASDAAKRDSALREAIAERDKALLQLRKGPILSELERLKNEAKARNASARVEGMQKSAASRAEAERAALRVLELKRERQQVTLDRLQSNMDRLVIKSPHAGMIAYENSWRSGSMGPPQEGDQMYPGQPLMRVFQQDRMIVDVVLNESDVAVLRPGMKAKLHLDAYPGAVFSAEMESASPVATAGLDSPVRGFAARFRVTQQDPRLLPDLTAALEIDR